MIIEYLLFLGLGLYFISGSMFLYLFLRTLRTKNGIGLTFLRSLTLSLSIGSFVIFLVRLLTEYGTMPFLTGRAIAVTNPMLLVMVGLYLNYLFHQKQSRITIPLIKDIKIIKENVLEVKNDVKIIKDKIVK